MSRWFRFYDDALDHAKVQRLPPDLFKAWVNLLCLASREGGVLPCVDDTAFALRVTRDVTEEWLSALRERGLIDVSEDGLMSPHNWNARQFRSDADPTAAERQARKRARDALSRGKNHSPEPTKKVTRDVTPPRTDTEADTEKEDISQIIEPLPVPAPPEAGDREKIIETPKAEKPKSEKPRNEYPVGFQQFWSGFPTDPNMSKTRAFGEWEKLSRADKETAIASLAAFNVYCRSHSDYRPIHAERYLKDRRFEGHAESAAKLAVSKGVYVRIGTRAWQAWEANYKQAGKGSPMTDKAGNGWYFPSEFPPDANEEHAA